MSDFKTRLTTEQEELLSKMVKLEEFIKSNEYETIEENQQILLVIQFNAMRTYNAVLVSRIALL